VTVTIFCLASARTRTSRLASTCAPSATIAEVITTAAVRLAPMFAPTRPPAAPPRTIPSRNRSLPAATSTDWFALAVPSAGLFGLIRVSVSTVANVVWAMTTRPPLTAAPTR
jgi:hypothetical protein